MVFDLEIHVLTFSFLKWGQNNIFGVILLSIFESAYQKPPDKNHVQFIAMYKTFDREIYVLTFDLSKSGQNGLKSKIFNRHRIQHTRKPPYTNFQQMYLKTRTPL